MRHRLLFVVLVALVGCGKSEPTMVHYQPISHWVQALRDPQPQARKKAVRLLGNVGTADPAVLPALIEALKDPDPGVRDEAVLALLKIGPEARQAVRFLIEAQSDKDAKVRSHAVNALERIRGGS